MTNTWSTHISTKMNIDYTSQKKYTNHPKYKRQALGSLYCSQPGNKSVKRSDAIALEVLAT